MTLKAAPASGHSGVRAVTAVSSAITALDIGLFLQHVVDPEEVPLDVYPPLYDLLFGELVEPESAKTE